ncbi:uncharacterized protein LOC106778214 isoform X4 [Vigna radiata var. radiata]|nr:uncharacterized protein LOC106778214 isoform X4 [Vigna radiata var. radiata]
MDRVLKPKVTNDLQHNFIRGRFSGFGKDSAIVGWMLTILTRRNIIGRSLGGVAWSDGFYSPCSGAILDPGFWIFMLWMIQSFCMR